jgi:hypothetical protein
LIKAVREGSEACFNDPFTPESFWHLTRFIFTRIIAFWITLSFGKDAKGLFTCHIALEKHFSFNECVYSYS